MQDLAFVFIHRGGASGAFRDRLLPFLARPALAVDLPLRSRLPNPAEVIEVDAGHLPAVTQPEAFARIFERIASTSERIET